MTVNHWDQIERNDDTLANFQVFGIFEGLFSTWQKFESTVAIFIIQLGEFLSF